ncbi:MAG: hypothetical protein MUC93_12725 [Bacteroidales bacterium]|jgi:hypothetical protein|nr:hypothetical protein [Bacteroidales bacterium]
MKKFLLIKLLILIIYMPAIAQADKQDLKREVTLFNPYKPSLPDVRKKSFLPDVNDTSKVRPDFIYDIKTTPFTPEYTVGLIKAASLLPDPLPKLYKSYIKLGFGNYFSPLAELSITNERSKKGAIGLYARHFSTNGKIRLQKDVDRVFAGYMDNDVSLFGKKFFRKNFLDGSLDFNQKTRYAYGYDTSIPDYNPEKKDIRLGYNNIGTRVSFESLNLDSANFSYDFDLNYDFFYDAPGRYQHNAGMTGIMAKSYKDFYVGSGISFDYYQLPDLLYDKPKYIASVSPFIKKSSPQWSFKAGLQLLLDKNMTASAKFHIYPDANFSFTIVPSYVRFFAGLNGKLEKNEPRNIIDENPFLVRDISLFSLPNSSHALIVSSGLQGNTGLDGNYLISASYSFINNMLLYSNLVFPDSVPDPQMGNFFIPLTDNGELFRIHGEINGIITDKISYTGNANFYKYTLSDNPFAWSKPDWDGQIGVRYNLRNKIIAGMDITAVGKRNFLVSELGTLVTRTSYYFETPMHVNIDLSAEYRYTKILSFWLKFNNISFNRYYEWAFYPSQRFLCLVGFTYSL